MVVFILNSNGTLEFKVTQSSTDVQILYYIKKELDLVKLVFKIKIIILITLE